MIRQMLAAGLLASTGAILPFAAGPIEALPSLNWLNEISRHAAGGNQRRRSAGPAAGTPWGTIRRTPPGATADLSCLLCACWSGRADPLAARR
jgi:hypothetical protein